MRIELTRKTITEMIMSATILILFAVYVMSFGVDLERSKTAPQNVIGTWRTEAPKYADRYFEITENRIIFGTGGASFDSQKIRYVESITQGVTSYHAIYYGNLGENEYRFEFYYDPRDGGVIRFKNQIPIRWQRVVN
ncbi:MAG: hypothetical protein GTO42_02710 [Candidatus Latescibacteria bacterium]|nr:hypothetical protein [Candidatus Latescibacterota bacterium]NIO01049.1 hypothetical protein [Candidatus Latescibacterota bacterium]NIO27448.1 hypothetical protein [Candidatus Latescibacterota bacterium]NIO54970.1 hypothetical protein [Candidatus Latescibacterota bacterium]NIT01059.1 hypothetical protein [Candidatus Latescibacterota bacterium]